MGNLPTSNRRVVVAIDGFAGCGKTSIARELSERLQFHLLNSGLLYRAIGAVCLEQGIDLSDPVATGRVAQELHLQMGADSWGKTWVRSGERTWYPADLSTESISASASKVGHHAPVRAAIVDAQRDAFPGEPIIAEGRDMTSVIFPDATVKFFIDAPAELRAQRRHQQLLALGVAVPAVAQIKADIEQRDHQDRTRAISPTIVVPDAKVVSNTGAFQETVQDMLDTIRACFVKNE